MHRPTETPPTPAWLEAAFLEELLASGRSLPLTHYRGLFPGHEQAVARLYSRHAEARTGASEPPHADREPCIGRYVLDAVVGRGGQGIVYRAFDPELDRAVAIKVGHPVAADVASSTLRLVREARAGARLTQPGVCPVLDHGIDNGSPYVVMPFLEGWSLRELLAFARDGGEESEQQEPLRAVAEQIGLLAAHESGGDGERRVRVARFIAKIATALAAVHEAGIVHRDLKPGNILVRTDGEPVILDLGLAKDECCGLPTLTGNADVLGTPAYIAPEQLRLGQSGPPADVWALGVVLIECLTGERPFVGPSREQLYRQILDSNPQPLRERLGHVPRELQVIVDVTLQKDPDRRYANARELAADLDRFAQRLPIRARTPGALARLWLWSLRKPALAACVLGLFAALVAALATTVFLLRERDRNAELVLERYGAMRKVTHDIVFDLIDRLGTVPGTASARRKLADRAIEYLHILEHDTPTDPDIRGQLVVARLRLGDSLGNPQNQNLGMSDAALEQFRLARREAGALQQVATTALERARLARTVADCDNRLGTLLLSLGRFSEARIHLQRSREFHAARDQSGHGSLEGLEHWFGAVAELATCSRRLGELSEARALELEAIDLADRLTARAGSEPEDFERVTQTTQVACVIRERLGRTREALEVLTAMHPKVEEVADRHPERERLQHSAIVFGKHIGRLLLAARRVDDARPVYARTLARLDRSRQTSHDESNLRLRLRILFDYGRGLVATGNVAEGLERLEVAQRGCDEILRASPETRRIEALRRNVRIETCRAQARIGRFAAAKQLAASIVQETINAGGQWTEQRLRDRAAAVIAQIEVLAQAGEFSEAQAVIAREQAFFGEPEHDDARDGLRASVGHDLERIRKQLEAHVELLRAWR